MPFFNLKLEPYIAEMWSYLDSATCSNLETSARNILVDERLAAAVSCPDEWVADWARTASHGGPPVYVRDVRELLVEVVAALTQLGDALACTRERG